MARWYRDKNHQHADAFYIDHCQKAPAHRVHRGKSRQKQQGASSGSKLGIHLKDIPQLISAVLLLNYFVVGQYSFGEPPWAHHAVQHYATSLLRWRSNVGTTRTLVFSSTTSFINIHHTSTPYILPLDTWTTEFYSFPNNFFRFHLLSNSPPHLFTSRRFSLKLNRPTFSLVSRWTPASVQSHTPVPTCHGRHHPPQICHNGTDTTKQLSGQNPTNQSGHTSACSNFFGHPSHAQHLPGSRLR